jgi:hypothetical protein
VPIPDLAEVKEYLGASSWPDEEITEALTAETAAQAVNCRIPATYPADLGEALKRRVARNLALRGVPLSVQQGDADTSPAYIPRIDPEIRRLEAPHRRLIVG